MAKQRGGGRRRRFIRERKGWSPSQGYDRDRRVQRERYTEERFDDLGDYRADDEQRDG